MPILEKLRSYGVSLNATNAKGPVICYALKRGNIDAFAYLLGYYLEYGYIELPGLSDELIGYLLKSSKLV